MTTTVNKPQADLWKGYTVKFRADYIAHSWMGNDWTFRFDGTTRHAPKRAVTFHNRDGRTVDEGDVYFKPLLSMTVADAAACGVLPSAEGTCIVFPRGVELITPLSGEYSRREIKGVFIDAAIDTVKLEDWQIEAIVRSSRTAGKMRELAMGYSAAPPRQMTTGDLYPPPSFGKPEWSSLEAFEEAWQREFHKPWSFTEYMRRGPPGNLAEEVMRTSAGETWYKRARSVVVDGVVIKHNGLPIW